MFLLFLFPVLKTISNGGLVQASDVISRDVKAYMGGVDFDSFKQVVDTWLYVGGGGGRSGENFLGVLFFWVPRSMWPGKPAPTGELVSSSLGYQYTNVANPLPAEAYVSFGLVGVVVVFILLGLITARCEASVRGADLDRPHSDLLFYAVATGFIIIILRGALNAVAPMFATAFVVYFVLKVVHASRVKQGKALTYSRH